MTIRTGGAPFYSDDVRLSPPEGPTPERVVPEPGAHEGAQDAEELRARRAAFELRRLLEHAERERIASLRSQLDRSSPFDAPDAVPGARRGPERSNFGDEFADDGRVPWVNFRRTS